MDGFFDGSLLKLIIPIILLILFSLPDALRKRRKYPSNRKRKEQERQQQESQENQAETTAQAKPKPVDEDIPDIAKPRTVPPVPDIPPEASEPEPEWEPTSEPVPEPVVTKPAPVAPPVSVPTAAMSSQPVGAVAPHLSHGEPWSGLSGVSRDIYAGLVWSELLEPPLALRQKRK